MNISLKWGQDKTICESKYLSTEKKPIIFGKLHISNEEDFCHKLHFSLPQIEPKQRALSLF